VSKLRMMLVLTVVAGGLGCAGIGQKLMELSGSEIHVGADAKHPDGFPLPPPEGGTITTSASVNFAGMETTTVMYEITTETIAVLEKYEQVMKDAGLTTTRTSDSNGEVVTGTGTDRSNWTAMVGEQGGKKTLTLVVVKLPPE
jgi:hypothetical protein